MNDRRIKEYVDDIFKDVKMTATAIAQKEALAVNITERVQDYMREGLSFDMAFEKAKNIVGGTEELTASFEKRNKADERDPRQYAPEPEAYSEGEEGMPMRKPLRSSIGLQAWALPALSPFIYLLLGFMFGWWAWGWIIIPVMAILGTPMPVKNKFVSLSPFIYLLFGFFFGWWAWGWIIIPVSAIMSNAVFRRA